MYWNNQDVFWSPPPLFFFTLFIHEQTPNPLRKDTGSQKTQPKDQFSAGDDISIPCKSLWDSVMIHARDYLLSKAASAEMNQV